MIVVTLKLSELLKFRCFTLYKRLSPTIVALLQKLRLHLISGNICCRRMGMDSRLYLLCLAFVFIVSSAKSEEFLSGIDLEIQDTGAVLSQEELAEEITHLNCELCLKLF